MAGDDDVYDLDKRDSSKREDAESYRYVRFTSAARCRMNFILVNGRTPCRNSVCALCGQSISNSYLREMGTQLYYCDQSCYADHCKKVMDLADRTRAALVALAPNRMKRPSEAELMLTT